jgi:hypothetical protein
MAFTTTVEEVVALPPGTYEAHFENIEQDTGNDGAVYWRWSFDVSTDDGEKTVTGLSSAKLSLRTKSAEWIVAITGAPVESDHDWHAMRGLPCRLVLTTKETDKGDFNDIEKILPAEEGQVRKEQAPQIGDVSPF